MARKRPLASASACIFELHPPRERLTACFCSPYGWPAPPAELVGGDSEARGALSFQHQVARPEEIVGAIDIAKEFRRCGAQRLGGTTHVQYRQTIVERVVAGFACDVFSPRKLRSTVALSPTALD